MFEKNKGRYITKGANEKLDFHLQLLMWNMIDELKAKDEIELDYLQVFELKNIADDKNYNFSITHSQEVPPYSKEYRYNITKPFDAKIFVIDDGEYSTMLLAEEY